jgi:ribosome biogenesis GTPase A
LASSYTTASKKSTTVAELRAQASEEGISNRKKFMNYQPNDKTFELIDKLGLCTVKNPKFMKYRRPNQRKWESHVEFPILQFFAGAKTAASFPEDSLPEIAVVGRSNVGKSKLINSLCSSAVVRTSDRPGVTKQLNFYEAHDQFHLVDMPGYGFAYAKEEVKASWSKLVITYMSIL